MDVKKPRVRIHNSSVYNRTAVIVNQLSLNTICVSGSCPNIGECWSKQHAAFMIMGHTCTRACRFCDVDTGKPLPLDPEEPNRLAQAVGLMNLRHVVITSVDRDDLSDGGAKHFADCIAAIRKRSPKTTIEVLTPDFLRKDGAVEIVVEARPDVYNHNIETVRRTFHKIKLGAKYDHSINLLKRVKELDSKMFTKSGIIAGMGETNDEIFDTMDDLRASGVDFLTVGQYLRPTEKHLTVDRYLTDEDFKLIEQVAKKKGFLVVSASAKTRSSYHADDDFDKLQDARLKSKPCS